MPKIRMINTCRYDKKLLKKGDTVEMAEKKAKKLKDLGFAVDATAARHEPPKADDDKKPADKK